MQKNPLIEETVQNLRNLMMEEASKTVGPLDVDFTLGGDLGIRVFVHIDMVKQSVHFEVARHYRDTLKTAKRNAAFDVKMDSLPYVQEGAEPTKLELIVPTEGIGTFRDYDADKAAQAEL